MPDLHDQGADDHPDINAFIIDHRDHNLDGKRELSEMVFKAGAWNQGKPCEPTPLPIRVIRVIRG